MRAICSCALLVYRHVQKTGGSTLRHFFRQQELAGEWEFYSPQGDRHWPETSSRVRTQLLLDFWEAREGLALRVPTWRASTDAARAVTGARVAGLELHGRAAAPHPGVAC